MRRVGAVDPAAFGSIAPLGAFDAAVAYEPAPFTPTAATRAYCRDADDAIDAMARDAGYDSQADAAATLGTTVDALRADLIVVEVAS